jgi:hypothetical protein
MRLVPTGEESERPFSVNPDEYSLIAQALVKLGVSRDEVPPLGDIEMSLTDGARRLLEGHVRRGYPPELTMHVPFDEDEGLNGFFDRLNRHNPFHPSDERGVLGDRDRTVYQPPQFALWDDVPADTHNNGIATIEPAFMLRDGHDPRLPGPIGGAEALARVEQRWRGAGTSYLLTDADRLEAANATTYRVPGLVYCNLTADEQREAVAAEQHTLAGEGVELALMTLGHYTVTQAKRLVAGTENEFRVSGSTGLVHYPEVMDEQTHSPLIPALLEGSYAVVGVRVASHRLRQSGVRRVVRVPLRDDL